MSEIQDFSSGVLNGSQYTPFTIDPQTQTRSSSETAFLRDSLGEVSGLVVYQSTQAMRIQFDGKKAATGVEVETGGMGYVISARKEVIVSAGAVSTFK